MEYLINYLIICELVGTAAFAVSGAIKAIKNRYDILGIITIGTLTGVGGGIIRDEIISDATPTAFVDLKYVTITIATSIIVYLFYVLKNTRKISWIITNTKAYDIADAIGLGIFTVMGTNVAVNGNAFTAVIMGMLTAVGGGIIRDVLCIQRPRVFMEEIYATAALAGSLTYYVLVNMGVNYIFVSIVSMTLVIGIRLFSIKWQWQLPRVN